MELIAFVFELTEEYARSSWNLPISWWFVFMMELFLLW
jgi:hypothetical protein